MRQISASEIEKTVRDMCIEANCRLSPDVREAIGRAAGSERNPLAGEVLRNILKNADIARNENIPICQDTGMAVFFVEIGEDVRVDGNIGKAIEDGVRRGYKEGYLRASVVCDPLRRVNTKDNTPPVIHYSFTDGDKIKITFAPKGFGSENMSAVKMLKPSDGRSGVCDFVLETVRNAASNPCPPIVVGVGIGGTFEKCAQIAKHALTRDIGTQNPDPFYAEMERELLERINQTDIGPQGFGGDTTALAVHIETYPTHIAGLPAAVNINCHVTRHMTVII